jgi:GNAT superfamily N-acetyltransferase
MREEYRKGRYRISTDPALLDLDAIHAFLSTAYWSPGVPRETVERAIRNSLSFGLYDGDRQAGFARVVTDRATFAYLADVFVLPPYRGRGLGTWLVETVLAHPDLEGLRRWLLATKDAHELYRRYGFTELRWPERFMEVLDVEVYREGASPDDTARS